MQQNHRDIPKETEEENINTEVSTKDDTNFGEIDSEDGKRKKQRPKKRLWNKLFGK